MRRDLIESMVGLIVILISLLALAEQSPNAPDERRAVGFMRTMNTAESAYSALYPEQGFACALSQLGPAPAGKESPAAANMIDSSFASGKAAGYTFTLNCGGDEKPFTRITTQAAPDDPSSGARAFCSDLYLDKGKGVGGIINSAKDGKAETCVIKGIPLH